MPPDSVATLAFLDRIGARANPVLVKEVRSALRGRAFTIGFILVLVLALVASTIAIVVSTMDGETSPAGMPYLIAVSIVFALGAHGLVPFSAMSAMSSEHDDACLELLQLSGISAGRVVLGKLGAAGVQAALIYAAFLPFLAFAFLLEGVDIAALSIAIAASFLASIAFSSFAILLGAFARRRSMRVVGFVALAVSLMTGVQSLFGWLAFGILSGGTSWTTLAVGLTVIVLGAAACLVFATARLRHAEENNSTAFRVLGTASLVTLCAFGIFADSAADALPWIVSGLLFTVPSIFMGVAEPPNMPRAALARARTRGIPWYGAPWMPGGGRAVLLGWVNFGLAAAAGALAVVRSGRADATGLRMLGALVAIETWMYVVLLLPSGIGSRWLDRAWVRGLVRIATIVFPIVLLLVPTFVGFLLGGSAQPFDHAGNPVHFATSIREHGEIRDTLGLGLLIELFALATLLNLPRAIRSFGELKRDRARRAALMQAEATEEEAARAPL